MKLKKLFRSNNQGVLYSIIALIIIGLLNVWSSSYIKALDENDSNMMYYFVRQAVAALLGGVFMMALAKGGVPVCRWLRFDYHQLQSKSWMVAMAVAALGLLVMTALFGKTINGSKRWIEIGIQFQPSEIAKIISVFLAAGFTAFRLKAGKKSTLISWELAVIVAMGAFVYKQPDLGTAAIIVAIGLLLYWIAGLPGKQMAILGFAVLGSVVYFAKAAGYRAGRIQAWFDPWEYAAKEGYQSVWAQMTIGSGGFTGMGWGQGISKYFYLPEAHTDFAFAMFCQEWGFVGALLLIILPFIIFTFYGFCIANQSQDRYGKMLAIGLTALISGQALSNILMVLGVLPVIGVPLPFISFGGTALVINMACVGILMNIGRENQKRLKQEQIKTEEKKEPEIQPVKLKLVSPLKSGQFDKYGRFDR